MPRISKREFFIVLTILTVAVFFRFYNLDSVPPGLYPDEAMNGNNALEAISTGDYKIFYPENNGREGLFINLQAFSIRLFGNTSQALRGVSAFIGVLTVLGLYLLVRELYNWQIAGISSYLLAILFWHVNFSRIGFRAIMLPFILVYGFYFLWRGLRTHNIYDFTIAGVFGGLGFHTYISYRIAPIIAITVFINYWSFLKKHFSFSEYEHARNLFLRGFVAMFIATVLIALPIGIFFLTDLDYFYERTSGGLSVFAQENPYKSLSQSIIKTLGMFNFIGDYNPRHNIPGVAMVPWPIGIFFIVGFIKELVHWLHRKHSHYSVVHTLLFIWFFVILLPGFLSTEAPHALRTIGVIPVISIFAGRGIWWLFESISKQYESRTVTITLLFLFLAFGVFEYNRYFNVWAKSPATTGAFSSEHLKIASQINSLPIKTKKYVVIEAGGVLVRGVPMPSQTIMYLTDSFTTQKQTQKNIFYLTADKVKPLPAGSMIFIIR